MTERNLTWRRTLLAAYAEFGGEADNVLITNFIVDLIKWDGDWNKLHTQLSKYKAQLAETAMVGVTMAPAGYGTDKAPPEMRFGSAVGC